MLLKVLIDDTIGSRIVGAIEPHDRIRLIFSVGKFVTEPQTLRWEIETSDDIIFYSVFGNYVVFSDGGSDQLKLTLKYEGGILYAEVLNNRRFKAINSIGFADIGVREPLNKFYLGLKKYDRV